jgi:chloramphenicol-sensitive protein RarD
MYSGLTAAALSYAIWGLFPLYFHVLRHIGAFEIVLHRSLWSFVFVWLVLLGLLRARGCSSEAARCCSARTG